MATHQNNNIAKPDDANLSAAETGNASNPTPQETVGSPGNNQLLDEKAEKYLREVASIEDLPDPQEQKEAEETMSGESEKG